MSDLFLRGRSASNGARVPGWLMRLAGAAIAMGIFTVAASLGFWDIIGVPIGVLRIGALLLGALLAPTVAGSWLWLALGALTTLSMIVSFTPVVRPMAQHFVRDDRGQRPPTADKTLDAVIVLSGEVSDEGRVTGSTMERLISGVQNARELGISAMALSATAPAFGDYKPSSEPDQRALVALMAPDVKLEFVHDVFSTRDEAVAFVALAKARGWRRVLLVTSPMHSRRACATFERLGLAVECRPALSRKHDPSRLESSESRREVFQDVLYELAAALLYRVRGWDWGRFGTSAEARGGLSPREQIGQKFGPAIGDRDGQPFHLHPGLPRFTLSYIGHDRHPGKASGRFERALVEGNSCGVRGGNLEGPHDDHRSVVGGVVRVRDHDVPLTVAIAVLPKPSKIRPHPSCRPVLRMDLVSILEQDGTNQLSGLSIGQLYSERDGLDRGEGECWSPWSGALVTGQQRRRGGCNQQPPRRSWGRVRQS